MKGVPVTIYIKLKMKSLLHVNTVRAGEKNPKGSDSAHDGKYAIRRCIKLGPNRGFNLSHVHSCQNRRRLGFTPKYTMC